MKLGIVGRIDNRGIGYQSEAYWRNLGKPRVLAVVMNDNWPCDEGRFGYADVHFANSNLSVKLHERMLDHNIVREFLDGLDAVLAVETVYDWDICELAREMGVKTFIVGNPEMYAHGNFGFPHPDVWCWPTDWRLDELPPGPLLPVPAWDRPQVAAPFDAGVLKVLVSVGRPAAGDRQGVFETLEAVQFFTERVHVSIYSQEAALPFQPRVRGNVTLDVFLGGQRDRWLAYESQHVLLSPRKYGGLHLPVIEALSCGLTTILPDVAPNHTWPGMKVRAWRGRTIHVPAGEVQTVGCHPEDIARAVDELARNRDRLRDEMVKARDWAKTNSWDELRPRYWEVLGS